MSMRRALLRAAPLLAKHMAVELPIAAAPISLATIRAAPSAAALSMMTFRAFRSSAVASSTLLQSLHSEIEFERANYTQPEELAGGPPSPFTLTETRGDTLMTLSRQHGPETVTVDVMVNEQPDEEPFETEEGALDVDVGVVFAVQVAKGDDSLVFECKSDGSYLEVHHVAVEPTSGEVEDSAYTGPVFEELDEEMQRQFVEYLEERGVTADLGAYLLRLVHDKEQREYMYWLERVEALVK